MRGDRVIDPDVVLRAGRLVVLVAGFVVAAYAVTAVESQYLDETPDRRRARFIVEDDEDAADFFLGRRWRLSPAWTVSLIGNPAVR